MIDVHSHVSDGWGIPLTPIQLVSMFVHVRGSEKTYVYLIDYFRQTNNVPGYDKKLTRVGPGMKVLPSSRAP